MKIREIIVVDLPASKLQNEPGMFSDGWVVGHALSGKRDYIFEGRRA